MNIVAYLQFETHPGNSELFTTMIDWAEQHANANFIIVSPNANFSGVTIPANVSIEHISASPETFIRRLKLKSALPKKLKKLGADLFIAPPQIIVKKTGLRQAAWVQPYESYSRKDIQAIDAFVQKYLIPYEALALKLEHYKVDTRKLALCYYKATGFELSVKTDLKEKVLEDYTNGDNYFIALASKNTKPNLISLLKAFSVFKKWQKSSFKLVIALSELSSKDAIPDFAGYKYKDDVVFINSKDDKLFYNLLTHAFASVYACEDVLDDFGLQSLRAGIPLITLNSELTRATYKNAAAYAYAAHTGIADALMAIYKGEQLCNVLRRNGHVVLNNYTKDNVVANLEDIFEL